MQRILILVTWLLAVAWTPSVDANSPSALKSDKHKVRLWNQFADQLYELHKSQVKDRAIRTEISIGGYATHPQFYEETRYYDSDSGSLLSRIQRERSNPNIIHMIEVNVYNAQNKLQRDYLAAYLPDFRNAPIQTLINLHAYHNELHAFRQFDASGDRIYEQCEGRYNGRPVMISLEEHEFLAGNGQDSRVLNSKVYQACFANIPEFTDITDLPASGSRPGLLAVMEQEYDQAQIDQKLKAYNQLLEKTPAHAAGLVARGNLYFVMHDFDLAIMDYSDALHIDNSLDDAYFGRGMALARNGQVREGIDDLTIYIKHHPDSSVALTKRGVRYLWLGDDKRAEADFTRALQLNPANAEAHDDMGVILARRGDYAKALQHFQQTVTLDSSYIKGYHNLAMVYFITGQDGAALEQINKALERAPDTRDSMLLKAEILERKGAAADAKRLRQEAEFLPEGNWSERLSVQ